MISITSQSAAEPAGSRRLFVTTVAYALAFALAAEAAAGGEAPPWAIWLRANSGLFAGSYAGVDGVSEVVPVDLHIRGWPPTPTALLALLEASSHEARRRNPRIE